MKLDEAVVQLLGLDPGKSTIASHGGGCSSASTYKIHGVHPDGTTRSSFLKAATGSNADAMMTGEHASLSALATVPHLAPRSHGRGTFVSSPGTHFLVTDFIVPARGSSSSTSLAKKLATLHTTTAPVPPGHDQPMYGFPVPTFCGDTQQDNAFEADWATFYGERRLLAILRAAEQNGQRVDSELSSLVRRTADKVVPRLLGKLDIQPVVVHGDLWSGNVTSGLLPDMGDNSRGEAVVFDPSAVYGHGEYDLGIMRMFGGAAGGDFYKEYHKLCPKTEPVDEYDDRVRLYEVYHHLNHYAMFGGGYRSGAVRILKDLVDRYG